MPRPFLPVLLVLSAMAAPPCLTPASAQVGGTGGARVGGGFASPVPSGGYASPVPSGGYASPIPNAGNPTGPVIRPPGYGQPGLVRVPRPVRSPYTYAPYRNGAAVPQYQPYPRPY